MGIIINVLLIVALMYTSSKWFGYYNATRGLLYYLGTRHDDVIDEKKAKELTDMATKRTIEEFFGKH